MTSQRTPGLGINPGHGYVKIVLLVDGHEPATVTLPALLSEAQQQLVGAVERIRSVGFGNAAWWIGDDALIGSGSRTALHQERINDPVFVPVLVKGALECMSRNGHTFVVEHAVAQAYCVSGLPAAWSVERDLAHALVKRLRSAAQLGRIKVIAEPLGLVYASLLDNNGELAGDEALLIGKVAVVDLGHHTVDVAIMQRMGRTP